MGLIPVAPAAAVTLVLGGASVARAVTATPLDAHTDLEFSRSIGGRLDGLRVWLPGGPSNGSSGSSAGGSVGDLLGGLTSTGGSEGSGSVPAASAPATSAPTSLPRSPSSPAGPDDTGQVPVNSVTPREGAPSSEWARANSQVRGSLAETGVGATDLLLWALTAAAAGVTLILWATRRRGDPED